MGVLAEAQVVLLGDLDIGPGLREAAHAAVEAIFRNLHAPVEKNARTGAGKRFVNEGKTEELLANKAASPRAKDKIDLAELERIHKEAH